MKTRFYVTAYFALVGACVSYLLWSLAFGPGGPFKSVWALVVWLLLTTLTLPWSLLIVFLTFVLALGWPFADGPLVGELYPTSAVALLSYFGAAALCVNMVRRDREARASWDVERDEESTAEGD